MSEKINKPKTKTQKWDNVQKIGFWGLILVNLAFWSGVYLGNVSAHNSINEIKEAQHSAVEEYKATLKQDQ